MTFSIIVPTHSRRRSLERLVGSLLRLETPPGSAEVIIVNDGSTDDTGEYLADVAQTGRVRCITIPNAGPAVARNAGAREARGAYLAFVDDDCTVPPDWLRSIADALRGGSLDAVGGEVRNALPDNPYAAAYEAGHRFFSDELNRPGGAAAFLTTNNFVCRAEVFRALGGFDERFHVGGEDREFVGRLIAGGHRVGYEAGIRVEHFHAFRCGGFIRQYYRFGKGSYLLHSVVGRESGRRTPALGLRGYLRMFRTAGAGMPLHRRLRTAGLMLLAQASAALGYAASAWEGLQDIPGEKQRIHAPGKFGVQGRVRELVTYLLGTLASSVIGFAAFFVLGRALPVEAYGLFTAAFSLTAFLQTLGSAGLSAALTRHVVEEMRTGDDALRRSMIAGGFLLFVVVLGVLVAALALLWDPLESVSRVAWPPGSLPLLAAGVAGMAALEFMAAAYQVTLRLLRLAVLRMAVAVLRLGLIAALLFGGAGEPMVLYAAFVAPAMAGAVPAFLEFLGMGAARGRPRVESMRRIGGYAWWLTLSAATSVLLQHAGALFLASVAGESDVGYYGLGMTFSFMYGVVGTALGGYYLPIASRLRSAGDVQEFLRRTGRINLPILVAALLSLPVAALFFSWFLGPGKEEAVPVFVLLSTAAISGIWTVARTSLFHYFLRPRAITVAQGLSILVFAGSAALLFRYGATGIAAAFLVSRAAFAAVLQILIRRELVRRGIGT